MTKSIELKRIESLRKKLHKLNHEFGLVLGDGDSADTSLTMAWEGMLWATDEEMRRLHTLNLIPGVDDD